MKVGTDYGSSGRATTDREAPRMSEQDFAAESVVTKPEGKNCLRRNWCWIVRIVLAIVGITIPLVMFLQPCEDKLTVEYTYVKQPVDLFLLLDGSGSMQGDWETCIQAAKNLTQVFIDSDISDLWIGSGEFDSYSYNTGPFTNDTELALSRIENLQPKWGKTYYQRALKMYQTTWQTFDKKPNSFSLLVFVSDGAPTDSEKGVELARALRNATHPNGVGAEINIAGIFVGKDSNSEYLKSTSNCDQCSLYEDEGTDCKPAWSSSKECPYFLTFSDFEEFNDKVKTIADELQDEIGNVERIKEKVECVKTPWLGFLALLLPLLCVLCMPLFVRKKRTYKRRVKKAPSVAVKKPPPEIKGPAPPPPPPESMPGFKKPKFKWKIKANDHYLWGGSAAPMRVDWGKKGATDSAPKDPLALNDRKAVVINQVDEGDGYIIEEIEEDRTLEQWTEDKAKDIAGNSWRVVCCCCPGNYDKVGSQDSTDLETATHSKL